VAFLDVVESARDQCRAALGATPVLLNVPADLRVWGDAARLEQMTQHILAHGAMAGRGAPVLLGALPWGRTARIAFEDQGQAPESLDELFTPFSPPRPGVDQGLGLAIARNIALEHDGSLVAEPASGGGVRIVLQLPLASAAQIRDTPVPVARSGRILLVEDEDTLSGLIAQTAREAGHTVVAVRSAEEALARLDLESFDALVADNRLPGMDGAALADALADRPIGQHVVLMSGSSQPPPREGLRFLPKPFRRTELVRALTDALLGRQQSAGRLLQ
jgi:CheY-like chemotaxis protein